MRLSRADREAVWGAVQEFHRLRADVPTILQVAAEAAHLLADGTAPTRYDHILVDEAQDLHPVQWRLLRAVVPPGPDDLFIVGDAHQRIYDNRVTLSSLGIEVRGRAHRLTVSYRTTAQILALATRLLGNESYDDFDGGLDTIAGYHSPLRGLRPDLEASMIRRPNCGNSPTRSGSGWSPGWRHTKSRCSPGRNDNPRRPSRR